MATQKCIIIFSVVVIVVAIAVSLTLFFTMRKQNCESLINRNPFEGSAIIGGASVEPGQYPWQVDLGVCGGTIIDPDHVITAAHCLCYKGTSDPVSVTSLAGVTIAVGTKYHLSKSMEECGKQIREIKSFKIHENYCGQKDGCGDRGYLENDIAILTLNESLKFNSFVQPACLPTSSYQYKPGSEVVVSGFGANDTRVIVNGSKVVEVISDTLPGELLAVKLSLMESSPCAAFYQYSSLPDSWVCAGHEEAGKASCRGDSGGPLIQIKENQATLIGVVSGSRGDCSTVAKLGAAPIVFARVSHFADWIEQNRME